MSPNRKEQWGIYRQSDIVDTGFVRHSGKPYLYFTRAQAEIEAHACQRAVPKKTYYAKKFNPHEKINEQ